MNTLLKLFCMNLEIGIKTVTRIQLQQTKRYPNPQITLTKYAFMASSPISFTEGLLLIKVDSLLLFLPF